MAGGPVAGSAGTVLQLIRNGQCATRSDLVNVTGLARSTISQRVDALAAAGLVVERGDGKSTGGRPPTRLAFNSDGGVVLAADFGATQCRLAVSDRAGSVLVEEATDLDIAAGPDACLGFALDGFHALLDRAGRAVSSVEGVGVGLPGPVEFAAGRVVSPPIMPGWDGVPVPPYFADQFPGVPVLVDNDVNVMAMGEYWARWRSSVSDLLFVKVGTGIGSGIVVDGAIHRGAQGAAGDIGHVQIPDAGDTICRCGNTGCVEAVAAGGALAAALRAAGVHAENTRDVVTLARAGNRVAVPLVRNAGRLLGEVLAGAVNFFNPSVIVLGGDLAEAHEQLFAGVREVVYRRSTTLATRHLQIVRSRLGVHAGVVGCAVTVLQHILSPEAVDARLALSDRMGEVGA
ncbi:MAG: ROK family transcriptional regulator [Acidimicrobiales bacterium]